jgi:transposase
MDVGRDRDPAHGVREAGIRSAHALLPGRNPQSIYVKACKIGLNTEHRPCPEGKFRKLVAPAMRLRKQGWSYAAIGTELGVCEATATNACLLGQCLDADNRPIERDHNWKITEAGRERIRMMFRKGMKHRDIQVRLGVAAATLTRERRTYEKELKERRLAPLPPPGGGERYSGVRVSPATKRLVVALYLEGYGTAKVSARTGVSKTHCLRARAKLIKRLKRKRECLPGCDIDGVRRKMKDHLRAIPESSLAELRRLLLTGEHSIVECGRLAVVGGRTAYKVFHELEAEFAARGEVLPVKRRGSSKKDSVRVTAALPGGRGSIDRYRALLREKSPAPRRPSSARRSARSISPRPTASC